MLLDITKEGQIKPCYVKIVRLCPAIISQYNLKLKNALQKKETFAEKQYSLRARPVVQVVVKESKDLKKKRKPKMNINRVWNDLRKKINPTIQQK